MSDIKTIFKKEEKAFSDYDASYKFWRVVHTDTGGYTQGELSFHIGKDSVFICSGDNTVYLDNEQLEYLLKVLREHGKLKKMG